MRNIFAERVQTQLKKLGISQSDLARRLKVSPQTVTQTLSRNVRPQQATLEKWAKALETTPDWLMGTEVAAVALELASEKMIAQDRLRCIEIVLGLPASHVSPALAALQSLAARAASTSDQHEGSG